MALRPKVAAHVAAIDALRASVDVDWICVMPAAWIEAGPRIGRYRTVVGTLVSQSDGRSTISYADFACAVPDELEVPRHSRQVLGVGD